MPVTSAELDLHPEEFVADANALKSTTGGPRLRRAELTVPICPAATLQDDLLCQPPRDDTQKLFVPRYVLQKHAAMAGTGGLDRFAITLKGDELRVTLLRAAPAAVAGSDPAALALPHRIAVTLLHGATAENFQEATTVPGGISVTLKSADANQLFFALTSDRSTRLRLRRQVKVAIAVDLGPEREQLRAARARHAALSSKKPQLESAIAAQQASVTSCEARVQGVTRQIHDLPGAIAAHQPAIKKLNGQIAGLKVRYLTGHRHREDGDPEDAERYQRMRAQQAALEQQIAVHNQQREREQNQLKQAQSELPTAQANLATAQQQLQQAQANAKTVAADLARVETEVRELEKSLRIPAGHAVTASASTSQDPDALYRESTFVFDHELPFLFPKELHPYIYRGLDDLFPAGEWRELDGPARNSSQVYVQRGEQPWVFYVLPTSFSLAFQIAEGVPAFKPSVYADARAGDFPEPRDMRVRLLLTAVPVIDAQVRAHLHQHLAQRTEQPFVLLRKAAAVEHAEYRPEIDPASTGAASTATTTTVQTGGPIDLRDGFTLEYHLRLDDYILLVKQQLASGAAGLRGNVFVTLHVHGSVRRIAIDVVLSFADLNLDCIAATWNRSPSDGVGTLRLRNPTNLDLSVGRIDLSLLRTSADGRPLQACAARLTQPLPIAMGERQELNLPLAFASEPSTAPLAGTVTWDAAEIEVSGVRATDFSPQRWLESVHRAADQAKVYRPISVFVVNLARVRRDDELLAGVKVMICQASQAPVDHFIAPDSPTWSTHVLRTLSQLLGGGDDEDRYALRFHSVYSDGSEGLPQRLHSTDTSLVLAALYGERVTSRYSVQTTHGPRAQLQDLGRAAAQDVIAWLEAHDATWNLAVAPVDSAADGLGRFDVHSGLLDFSGPLRFAIVTLKSLSDTTTLTLNSASAMPQIWRPAQRGSTVDFEVTYVLDGHPPQSSRGQSSTGFLLLKPPL